MVSLEKMTMHTRERSKRITETFYLEGPGHDIPVSRPFEDGAEDRPGNNADGTPKQEHHHKTTFNFLS
jgi:hypothetical protein